MAIVDALLCEANWHCTRLTRMTRTGVVGVLKRGRTMGRYRRLAVISVAAALLFGAGLASAVSAADGRCSGVYGITLFDYATYGDPSSTFCGSAGHTTDYDNVGGMHDRTTSLQIFNRPVVGRTRVRAFKDPYFGGDYFDFYASTATMPSGWNNVLDSMILVP